MRPKSGTWSGVARSKGYMRNGSGVDADSNSERAIMSQDDKGIEMENRLSGIHKQVEVEVRVEDGPVHETRSTYTSGNGSKSWVTT